MRRLPRDPDEWLTEVADAYADAFETLPLMPLVNVSSDESVLFHLAPRVAVKFRGLSEERAQVATEAALASYVASREHVGAALDDPYLAFAFCYLAAHFGIEIVGEKVIQEVMAYIEDNPDALHRLITKGIRK